MKQNKQTEQLDTTQPVAFEVALPGLTDNFTITGDYESVAPIYEAYNKQIGKLATNVVKTPSRASTLVTSTIERAKVDSTTLVYDLINHTNFYELIKTKRQYNKNLAMARKLGLISSR